MKIHFQFILLNKIEKNIRIYALNLDKNEKILIYDKFDDTVNSNVIEINRRIPTQYRYFNIDNEEFLILGFRDCYIILYKIENNELKE